jgi:hypothetical protein
MTKQKINKSAFVDSNGKVWGSVGENIRNGSKSYGSLKASFDNLTVDELINLPLIPINGHWEQITDNVDTSFIHNFSQYSVNSSNTYAELSVKIYSIIQISSETINPRQLIAFPLINHKSTYIEFLSAATSESTADYLIYIGDE